MVTIVWGQQTVSSLRPYLRIRACAECAYIIGKDVSKERVMGEMVSIHRIWNCSTVLLIILLIGVGQTQALQFKGLGALPVLGEMPGPSPDSKAMGISGDGSTIVGQSTTQEVPGMDFEESFRWTAAEDMVSLNLSPPYQSYATAASYDGSMIVGMYDFDDGFLNAYYWTEQTGMAYLGESPMYDRSIAGDISADGSVIVGFEAQTKSMLNAQAVRWTESGQNITQLGDLGGNQSWASGVSADGSVIVGTSINASGQNEAFWWNETDGLAGLGSLTGYDASRATSISADASTIVGSASSANAVEAFRWTELGGMTGLGDLAGGAVSSKALDVSADGSIIVGTSESANGEEAFIWDAENGMRSILDVFENDYASDLQGWVLLSATGISDDGSVITGYGINPAGLQEAWAVDYSAVPLPNTVWMMLTGVIGIAALRFKMQKQK